MGRPEPRAAHRDGDQRHVRLHGRPPAENLDDRARGGADAGSGSLDVRHVSPTRCRPAHGSRRSLRGSGSGETGPEMVLGLRAGFGESCRACCQGPKMSSRWSSSPVSSGERSVSSRPNVRVGIRMSPCRPLARSWPQTSLPTVGPRPRQAVPPPRQGHDSRRVVDRCACAVRRPTACEAVPSTATLQPIPGSHSCTDPEEDCAPRLESRSCAPSWHRGCGGQFDRRRPAGTG